MELPDGERGDAARLQVHVEQWPDSSGYEEDMQDFAQKVLQVQKGRSGSRRTKIRNRQQIRTVAASAPPESMIAGPEGLGPILESESFRVSGQALFRPLQPFDPDPEMPNPEERFLAIEEIQYSYP